MKKLGVVTPMLFENHLIISFEANWIDQFEKIPTFDICIDNKKRLCLTSKEELKSNKVYENE